MTAPHDVVALLDCDNTLLDNDLVQVDLGAHLEHEFGSESRDRYWKILEQLRAEVGYVDCLGAAALSRRDGQRPAVAADVFVPGGLPVRQPVVSRCSRRHPTPADVGSDGHLSDGDVVFQPRKIQRSGLWAAVEGRVLICIHKEQMLDVVAERYPARHYVMVDDKLRILAAMKRSWGDRLTTIFPRQGDYALDPTNVAAFPAADVTVERIGDLVKCSLPALPGATADQVVVPSKTEPRPGSKPRTEAPARPKENP